MTSRQRSKESNEPLSLESKYLSQSLETKTQVDHNQDFQPIGTEKSMNESAYVLLEDTEVVLLSPSDDNHSNALPFQKWVDIKMRPLCKTKILDKHIEDETIDSHSMSGDQHDGKTDEKVIGDNASELQEEKKYTTATQSQSMGDLFCDRCDLVLNVSNERFGESEDVHTTANKNSYEYICIESKDNPRFDGTMSDCRRCDSLKCSKTSCHERTNQHGTMNRSDAALLVGAALLSQEKSLLHLQNFQLFIHEILREEMTNASQNETSNFDVKNGSLLKVYRCTSSILMTFSLPQVERAKLEIHSILKTGNTGNISSRIPDQRKRRVSTGDNFLDESKQNEIFGKDKTLSPKKKLKASYSNSFISKKRKSLNLLQEKTLAIQKLAPRHNEIPPCAELLYTLLRSDWQTLTNKMRSIMKQKKHNTTSFNSVSSQNEERKYKTELLFQERKDTKLFPVELTLEELYKRIQGAASHVDDNPIYNKTSQYTYILLPDDILLSKIAPFLQAKSLDSFRCSCRYLHNVLKSIVPGMKLRLYLHQIKSLEWMRRRECRNVSEGDILRKFYSSKPISFDFFNQSSNGHDLYRSLSAGAVLTLEDKMPHVEAEANCVNEKYPGNKWQIDTRTGNILRYFHDDNFFMESSSLISPTMQTRKIARGGLLCDDPLLLVLLKSKVITQHH